MPTDYSKSQIYKIYCKDENVKDIYVGLTTDFIRRKFAQKKNVITNISNTKLHDVLYTKPLIQMVVGIIGLLK